MEKLTAKQVKEYISSGGTVCPYCECDQLEGIAGVEVNDGVGYQGVKCTECGKTWTDIYRLVNLEPY